MTYTEPHLLIVDDNPTNIEVLTRLLGPHSYALSTAKTGGEALEMMRHEPCDLVLMDIMMPGISGIEVCRQMQDESKLSTIPVIFVTAMNDPDLLVRAFQAGGVDYLTKPFIAEELLARIQIHLRLRAGEERLRKLLAMRELMMSTLSHDLRGPIGTIAQMLELMKGPMPAERSEKIIQNLAASARRSYELLEDLLTWSRAMTEELPFNPMLQPLRALAQECLDFHRLQAEAKELTLENQIPSDLRFRADANLVRTILINLLGNAIKFTPSGGTVTLACESRPEHLVLQVLDTGPGIPDNLSEQLERNQPISSQVGTHGEKGTGMGLKICQEFAARHSGWLEISKLPGQGSCFALVLPLIQAPEPQPAEAAPQSEASSAASNS